MNKNKKYIRELNSKKTKNDEQFEVGTHFVKSM